MNNDLLPSQNASRRNFIKGAACTAASFMIVPRHVLGGVGFVAPSDTVTLGMVGVGGKGRKNTEAFLALDDVRITAIADPAYYWNLADFYYRSEAGRGPVKDIIEEKHQVDNPSFQVAEYD
ncbi:MAG: gfo/Idh/MocA family oxidoreductase, partial [Bacteroidota bacterium]